MEKTIQVLVTVPLAEDILAKLRRISPNIKLSCYRSNTPDDIPIEIWNKAEILYTSRVLPPNMESVPKLRWIQVQWSGVDHFLESPFLDNPDIKITTSSGADILQIAEHIILMFLALGHHIPSIVNYQKKTEWPADRWERFSPRLLSGSVIGIVGYGSIGRQLARLLYPFGPKILATKRNVFEPGDHDYIPDGLGDPDSIYVHRLYPGKAIRHMLKECDFVVIALPKTKSNLDLIGQAEFSVLKPTSYLVDVSRGGIVNHNALITALKEQKIAGAALDVFPTEPLPADSLLWKMSNVIITPHIAGISNNYDEQVLEVFRANLLRYLAGEKLLNQFDPDRGY